MDFAWDGSRLDSSRFPSLALDMIRYLAILLFSFTLLSGQITKTSSAPSSPFSGNYLQYIFQPVEISITNTNAASADFSWGLSGAGGESYITISPGATRVFNVTPLNVSAWPYFYQWSSQVSWTGLSSTNPVVGNFPASNYSVSYSSRISGFAAGSGVFPVSSSAGTSSVTFTSGNQSTTLWLLPVRKVVANIGDTNLSLTPSLVPKVYGSGVLFLDNLTGIDQKSAFGSEEITLKPGYNSIPFTGELDPYGFPKAMPSTWALSKTVGPDGQVIWSGRIASGVEGGPPVWTQIQGPEIFAGVSGSGPSIKVPNGKDPALSDYVTLPAGMTKGGFNTLPGGMTAGSPGLPAGVTGGSSGALPSGVLSGGSVYLPPNVSAGTKAGQGGVTPGQVAGTGTTATTSGASTRGEAGGYIPGASMDGMLEKGVADGKAAAEKITTDAKAAMTALGEKGNAILGAGSAGLAASYLQIGTGASAVGGADRSWLNVTIPIAQYNIPLVVPSHWIDLIRSILVWGVKIWFVVAVLKLLMR